MIEYDAEEYAEGYSRHLTAVLRRDPDVVMVDPIDDDKATVRTLLETDEPPVMYLPLRAGSLGESLQKFMTLAGGDAKAAVKNLKYVVHQRLVRRPCPDCSVPLNATPELLQKLGLSEEEGAGLVKGLGQVEVKPGRFETCDRCHGSGFSGVTGVLEVLKVTDEIRGHLANKDLKAALVAGDAKARSVSKKRPSKPLVKVEPPSKKSAERSLRPGRRPSPIRRHQHDPVYFDHHRDCSGRVLVGQPRCVLRPVAHALCFGGWGRRICRVGAIGVHASERRRPSQIHPSVRLGLGLAVPFILSFVILRVLCDSLIKSNLTLPKGAELGIGGVCGRGLGHCLHRDLCHCFWPHASPWRHHGLLRRQARPWRPAEDTQQLVGSSAQHHRRFVQHLEHGERLRPPSPWRNGRPNSTAIPRCSTTPLTAERVRCRCRPTP